jgi:hypothetical protein
MSTITTRLSEQRAMCQRVSMFATGNMLPCYLARHQLAQLELEAHDAGVCCGDLREGGICGSRVLELRRMRKLVESGMGPEARRRIARLCEHADTRELIETAYAIGRESGLTLADITEAFARNEE